MGKANGSGASAYSERIYRSGNIDAFYLRNKRIEPGSAVGGTGDGFDDHIFHSFARLRISTGGERCNFDDLCRCPGGNHRGAETYKN